MNKLNKGFVASCNESKIKNLEQYSMKDRNYGANNPVVLWVIEVIQFFVCGHE